MAGGQVQGRPSRLDRMIARLTAQRAALEVAASLLAAADVPGPIVEVGLGKGRTYSHLRCLFGDRRILCLDGSLHAPPEVQPPAADLILGDFETSLAAPAWLPSPAALIHIDCGTEDAARDARLIAALSPSIASLVAPHGIVISDRPPTLPGFTALKVHTSSDWPISLWQAPSSR